MIPFKLLCFHKAVAASGRDSREHPSKNYMLGSACCSVSGYSALWKTLLLRIRERVDAAELRRRCQAVHSRLDVDPALPLTGFQQNKWSICFHSKGPHSIKILTSVWDFLSLSFFYSSFNRAGLTASFTIAQEEFISTTLQYELSRKPCRLKGIEIASAVSLGCRLVCSQTWDDNKLLFSYTSLYVNTLYILYFFDQL